MPPAAKSVTLPVPDSLDAAAASVTTFAPNASSHSPPLESPREKSNADNVNQAECPICMNDENMIIKTDINSIGCACGKYFHKDCLRKWLVSASSTNREWRCPTCKKDIKRYNGNAEESRIHSELFEHRKTQFQAQVMDKLKEMGMLDYILLDDLQTTVYAAVKAEFNGRREDEVLQEVIERLLSQTTRRRVLQQPDNRQLLTRSRLTNRLVAAKTSRSA